MAVRCIKDTWVFFRLGGIITTLSILLGFEIIYFQKNKINYLVYAYFLAALAANYAMIFIEYNPERTFFMSGIFLIITLLCLIKEVLEKIKRRYIVMAVMAVVIPFFLPSFISGIKSIAKGYVLSEAREHYILSQKRKGVLDIQVKTPIPADDFHSGLKDGLDVLPQVDVNNIGYIEYITHNSSKAVYYGIHSLQGIMVEDKNWGNWKDWKKILKDSWKRRHSDYLTKDDWFLMIYDDWQ
ncbi:hypothetical protein FACS189415_3100 [Bacteroidia bacterium]|nr:hypothetical protein FACS189426_16530 [Bacteroidia bacterium]GHU82518.1 hypothetical protein FACS189415_3100 [Bacteroidia bacterium]